jgi:hypothetical protein
MFSPSRSVIEGSTYYHKGISSQLLHWGYDLSEKLHHEASRTEGLVVYESDDQDYDVERGADCYVSISMV